MGAVYVPIVKGHENDLRALSLLHQAWIGTKPLIEYTLPKPGTDTCADLVTFIERIKQYVALKETFVDFYGFPPGTPDIDGKHPVAAAFDIIRAFGLPVTPVVGFDREVVPERTEQMWRELVDLVIAIGRGFCFRVDIEELDGAQEETWEKIIERSAQLKIAPSQTDVVIDLRSIRDRDERALKDLVIDFALGAGQFIPRSMILAGSSALHTVKQVPENGTLSIERKELRLWAEIFADTQFQFPLIFGDYGVVYPDFDREGSFGNINAKIRYTANDKIHYFRGKLYSKVEPHEQYHMLSQQVMASPYFIGSSYSFGDRYIHDCVKGWEKPRQPGPWVLADQNHHFVHTAHQMEILVARLPGAEQPDIDRLLAGAAPAVHS